MGSNNNFSFEEFVDRHRGDILGIQKLLDTTLSDNPAELQVQLREIEAWYGRVSTLLAHADYFLDIHASRILPNKESGTELERKTSLDALCAPQRRFRDVLDGIARAISQRVSLGQILIKSQEREVSST